MDRTEANKTARSVLYAHKTKPRIRNIRYYVMIRFDRIPVTVLDVMGNFKSTIERANRMIKEGYIIAEPALLLRYIHNQWDLSFELMNYDGGTVAHCYSMSEDDAITLLTYLIEESIELVDEEKRSLYTPEANKQDIGLRRRELRHLTLIPSPL